MKLIPGGATDQGQVREANEDGYLVDRRLQLFAVADGMGGHRAGEIASATALEALRLGGRRRTPGSATRSRARTPRCTARPPATRTCAAWAPRSPRSSPTATASSSATSATPAPTSCATASSRQLTTDHSLVEELIRDGRLTEEQAAVHPQRSIITRALGVEDNVEVDLYPVPLHGRRPAPDLLRRPHHDGAAAGDRRAPAPRVRPDRAPPTCSSTRRTRPAARTTSRRSCSTSRTTAPTRSRPPSRRSATRSPSRAPVPLPPRPTGPRPVTDGFGSAGPDARTDAIPVTPTAPAPAAGGEAAQGRHCPKAPRPRRRSRSASGPSAARRRTVIRFAPSAASPASWCRSC